MQLLTLTPPAAEPIPLAEAKAWLRAVDDDALIARLLAAARDRLEAETGLALGGRRVLEIRDRWALDRRFGQPLALRPATLLHGVRLRGGGALDAALDPADPGRLIFPSGAPSLGGGVVEIDYDAGAPPPPALQHAVLVTAAWLYEGRDGASALPPAAKALAAPFAQARL